MSRVAAVFSLLVGVVFLFAIASAGEASVQVDDSFDGNALASAWTWENPGLGSTYSIAWSSFTIDVARANDEWVNTNRAPRILRNQPAGAWTIETKVATSGGNGNTFAGLTVFKDAGNWLHWGWLSNSSLEASGVINNAFTQPFGVMATRYPYLRVRRVGISYYFDASSNGVNWTNANVYRDDAGRLAGARIGIMARDWNTGTGSSYTVGFDYFRQYDQDVMPSALTGAPVTRQIVQETGASSINETDAVDVCGTDLGVSFEWQNRTYFAFGDTKECHPAPTYRRSNTLAFSSDSDPTEGVKFDGWITDRSGMVSELFAEDRGGLTAIPTAGIGVADRAYLFYMNVTSWDSPPGAWSCNQSSVASARAGSPGAWTKYTTAVHWGSGNFNQLAVNREGTTLYIWGAPCGRFGSVKLMRVEEGNILQQGAYQYFAGYDGLGQPLWSPNEGAAVTVAGGPAGELSVRFNPYLGRYLMTYLDQRKSGIVLREAPRPWGPWSAPVVIASDPPFFRLYGGFMPERFNGKSFYYMMSQGGPYNAFWMQTTLP